MRAFSKLIISFVLFFVVSAFMIAVASAISSRAGLGRGDSIRLEEQNLSSPITQIVSEAATSNADIKTTLERKSLGFYTKAGTNIHHIEANHTYTMSWNVSGTKDTRATWENIETDVGCVVIGNFILK